MRRLRKLGAPPVEKVDFFIAGVQKGGTTALDAMLRQHPRIQMAAKKEPHFFDRDKLDWADPDYGKLHKHFRPDWAVSVRGEATPIYTYWPGALKRLKAYNPDARIIVCLRDPAARAYSHWKMVVTRGREDLEFGAAIREGRERVHSSPGGVNRSFSYVERGFYADQTRRVLAQFPREHVCFLRTDHLEARPSEELQNVWKLLGIRPVDVSVGYVVHVDTRHFPPADAADLAYLRGLYAQDVAKTTELTGLDLADWLAADG